MKTRPWHLAIGWESLVTTWLRNRRCWGQNVSRASIAKNEDEFASLGKVRQLENGNIAVNIKRKAFKSDGTANLPVSLVDASKKPITTYNNLGNGSTGNVKVYRAEYEYAGKKGITTIMSAIQITDLVIYTGSVDFDMEADESPMAAHDDF